MSITDSFRVGPNASRAPTASAAVARQTRHPDADGYEISDITTPLSLDPGETITVGVEVTSYEKVGPLADDFCLTGPTGKTGQRLAMTIDFAGATETETYCHEATGILSPPIVVEQQFELTAPTEPGKYDMAVTIVGADTGALVEEDFKQITVVGDDEDDGTGGDDGDNDGGSDEDEDLPPCEGLEDTFTRNECCPLNPSLTFRIPPRVGTEVDLQEDAPNLCAAAPIGLVVLVVVAWVIVNLSPARIAGSLVS